MHLKIYIMGNSSLRTIVLKHSKFIIDLYFVIMNINISFCMLANSIILSADLDSKDY